MSKDKIKINDFPFEVNARVALQLGRESISSSLVAILELVKNSYDANAKNVLIKFSSNTIEVSDDGNGMSQSGIINNWLTIGTDHKVQSDSRKEGDRILTGAKGLGRLGIDRLCDSLTLETKSNHYEDVLQLVIDWKKYENHSAEKISQIKHSLYQVSKESSFFYDKSSGTLLRMHDLKDDWFSNDLALLRSLHKELTLLVSPFGGVHDFTISIDTGLEDNELNGAISSGEFLSASDWKVSSCINADETVSIKMSSQNDGKSYSLENVPWIDWVKDRSESPRCGSLQFDFYFYLSSKKKEEYKKINFDKSDVKNFLDNNCGIRIYRDEFRVKPYGNPDGEGDWLLLQNRKAKEPAGINRPTWKVGLHQVVGAVFISRDDNVELIDQTNREGIVEEAAFFDLRAFAIKNIQWFEQKRYDSNRSNNEKKAELSVKAEIATSEVKKEIDDLILLVDEENTESTKIKSKLLALEEKVEEHEQIHTQYKKAVEYELNLLANLASLGILTVSFGHESLGKSNLALTTARELKYQYEAGAIELLNPNYSEFLNDIETVISSTEYINTFAGFALGNVKFDKRKQRNIILRDLILGVFNALNHSLSERRIEINLDQINNCSKKIHVFPIDWESIFINLITNSIYALKKMENDRKIKVAINELDSGFLEVVFSDNGPGIEAGIIDNIFEPHFSTRRDRKGNVIGTGMGLAIVKTFVEDHSNGSIIAVSNGALGGAEFRISVPYMNI